MYLGTQAEKFPDRPALVIDDSDVVVSYAELDARSNQVAHGLRRLGLAIGDTIAVMMPNCEQFFEVWWAAMRSGLYVTTINWHLTAPEVEYVVADSGADVLFFGGGMDEVVEASTQSDRSIQLVAIGGSGIDRAVDFGAFREGQPTTRVGDETDGSPMFYSSGTTGRPKGIRRRLSGRHPSEGLSRMAFTARRYGISEGQRYLSPGPLYHGAPAIWSTTFQALGGTSVVMRRFDAEMALRLIDHQQITDSQWVPTMFQRMLRLPEEVRNRYDISSMKRAWSAAAPISIELKKRMIEWWGDIILEYYSASEGGGTIITTAEWLSHPGSVGKHYTGDKIYILDPSTGEELPAGEEGAIYFRPQPGGDFEYHNDPEKTADAHSGDLFTAGDIGYLDDEGYLYLTDRQSNMIISGGMNIYPREVEDAIAAHPAVADVAVFGVPDADLGEHVHAVIQPLRLDEDRDRLIADVEEHLKARLARQKSPRSYEVRDQLPRDENGKLYKRRLRAEHWEGSASRLV